MIFPEDMKKFVKDSCYLSFFSLFRVPADDASLFLWAKHCVFHVLIAMRVLALASGGKDSTMAMTECVKQGHTIVALANLKPKDEKGKKIKNQNNSIPMSSIEYEKI